MLEQRLTAADVNGREGGLQVGREAGLALLSVKAKQSAQSALNRFSGQIGGRRRSAQFDDGEPSAWQDADRDFISSCTHPHGLELIAHALSHADVCL